MTQEDLVRELGSAGWDECTVRTIQRHESGETTGLSWIARLAYERVFGMPAEQLGFRMSSGEIATASDRPPKTFYFFDRADDGPDSLNRRAKACWDWCKSIKAELPDEFVAWFNDAYEPFPRTLAEAIQVCIAGSAALLVHETVRIGDARALQKVLTQLGGENSQLWTLKPIPQRVTLDMLPSLDSDDSEAATSSNTDEEAER